MKYYELKAVVDGDTAKLKRNLFATRGDAINYMFKYYRMHYIYNLQVVDEYPINGNKHNIEYVCDFYNRFTINRVTL